MKIESAEYKIYCSDCNIESLVESGMVSSQICSHAAEKVLCNTSVRTSLQTGQCMMLQKQRLTECSQCVPQLLIYVSVEAATCTVQVKAWKRPAS